MGQSERADPVLEAVKQIKTWPLGVGMPQAWQMLHEALPTLRRQWEDEVLAEGERLNEAARVMHVMGCAQNCTGDPSPWRENALIVLRAALGREES